MNFCDFEASLLSKASSRAASSIQREALSQKQTNKNQPTKKKKPKKQKTGFKITKPSALKPRVLDLKKI